MSIPLSVLVNVSGVILLGVILGFVIRSTSVDSPFFYHPVGMAFAFAFLMTQGVLLLTSNVYILRLFVGESNRKAKITVHFWLQMAASAFYTIGFFSIVYNKFSAGKMHFRTWHSWVGMASLVLCWIQVFGGMYLYYSWPKLIIGAFIKLPDITMKKLHRLSGALGFALGMVALTLATYSGYATTYFPDEINIFICAVTTALAFATVPLSTRMSLPSWMQ